MRTTQSDRVVIKLTWRQLLALFTSSPGITIDTPPALTTIVGSGGKVHQKMRPGRTITGVDYSRTATGRRRLDYLAVSMSDGWGFGVEKCDWDKPVSILD